MSTFVTLVLEEVTCCNCGLLFGLESSHKQRLLRSHETFTCPAGHQQHFTGESDVERLKREKAEAERMTQLARESRDREQQRRFQTERRLQAQKGATTRLKRRAAAGTCPCCQRTFHSLTEHMKKQHPDFIKSAKLPEAVG